MAKWVISKEFSFDYGHRVWTQQPDVELSCGHQSVCRHIHGHRGTVIVNLCGDKLNAQGMVTDFVNLNWFKKFLDVALDHKMIIDVQDPALLDFFPLVDGGMLPYFLDVDFIEAADNNYKTTPLTSFWFVDERVYMDKPDYIREIYEGLVIVDFVPTSENLSKWLLGIVQKKMDALNVEVSHIEFFETPKSKSVFYHN